MRFVRWLGSAIFANFGFKVLSLAAAFAIWALVASEPELSTFVTAPVEYKNLPAGLEISSNAVPAISLELQGPAGQLTGGAPGPVAQVVIDMSDAAPGEHTYTIGERSLKLPRGVRLVRAVPQQLRFLYEKIVARNVPVEVRTINEGQQGYYIASTHASPSTFQITGPASHVAAIKEVSTDAIDLSGVVTSKEFQTNAYVLDPLVKFVGSPQVAVQITMKKK